MWTLDLPAISKKIYISDICYDDIKLDLIEGQFEGQQVDEQIL